MASVVLYFFDLQILNNKYMKSNEVRVGNFILFSGVQTRVIPADFATQCRGVNSSEMPNFKPIQLNEEWLLSAGFEKLTSIEKGFKSNSYTYSKGFSFIVHLNNGLLSTNFWQGNEKKFVHELQNLFFSLTGEDLVFSTEP